MSLEECARISLDWWGPDTAPSMLAIAGAESNFEPTAAGDHISIFNRAQQTAYAPFACDGWLSHGYWQIFLGVHTPLIRQMSGLHDPCALANWLHDGNNNARAAAAIRAERGSEAPWSTFQQGLHLPFLPTAQAALENLSQQPLPITLPPLQTKPFPYARLGQMFRALGDAIESIGNEAP